MYQYEYPHPAVTTDAVIFTIRDCRLQVLLIQRGQDPQKGDWAFPGGFIEIDEDLDAAVRRELREETGLTGIKLRQFRAFGAPKRDPRERIITVAYLALVAAEDLRPQAADDAVAVAWFDLGDLPVLAFDHAELLAEGYSHLCSRLCAADLTPHFLPSEFTADDLANLYAVVWRRNVDAGELLTRLQLCGEVEVADGGAHSEPGGHTLYRAVPPGKQVPA